MDYEALLNVVLDIGKEMVKSGDKPGGGQYLSDDGELWN